mgnify:CR=1 FL=1
MATQNYFAMDPAISRTVSNLTRALLGSASDDAAIARARYYDEQTKAQQLQSRGLEEQLDAQNKASLTPLLQNQVANVFGGEMNNGNLIQRVLPGGPQQSVPLLPNQNQMSQDDVTNQLGALARSMYGDGTSNANQLSQMLGNLAESGQSRLAQSMILSGSPDQAQRGALMMAPQGGQFQNPDFAGQKLAAEQATEKREDDMRFGLGGQGDRDTIEQEATKLKVGMDKNQVTREVGMDKNARQERWEKYKTDANAKVDREKNEAADATARYKIDNEPVEINVTPGKKIILDPTTAERIGVNPVNDPNSKFNGLHVLDGGKKPGDVVVKVGKEDVFMDEATAKALGIPKNENNQYVLPGAGFSTTSSGSGSGFTVASSDDTNLRNTFNAAANAADMRDIPGGVQDLLVNEATSASVMGNKKNMAKGNAYIKAQLRKGFEEIEVPNSGMLYNDKIRVPVFLIEQITGETDDANYNKQIKFITDTQGNVKPRPLGNRQQAARMFLTQVGYETSEIDAIIANVVR